MPIKNVSRHTLSGEDFKKLVCGKIVYVAHYDGIAFQIVLSDLGFGVMRHILEEAEKEENAKANPDSGSPETGSDP